MPRGNDSKFGSCWTTVVELEFHHVMLDQERSADLDAAAPFPPDATSIACDGRSGFLVWLQDGTPAHARWCEDANTFKRIGDDVVLDRASVRAWAALPFPIAGA
ncbi:MAG: hypothetical protein DI563_15990 [Variovorax paradoxus]|uniref:Uncharacterized protein n=1 Tax=Variovorax paradoxus TaxID=34073 RepID=A0A2W5Q7E3_VARPD|nr:MAG: hypothetical protein DI563_15990 [Variovorax paradoxus]